MKRMTLDKRRVYSQTRRNRNRSMFNALLRAIFGTPHVCRGEVDTIGDVQFYGGGAPKPIGCAKAVPDGN